MAQFHIAMEDALSVKLLESFNAAVFQDIGHIGRGFDPETFVGRFHRDVDVSRLDVDVDDVGYDRPLERSEVPRRSEQG